MTSTLATDLLTTKECAIYLKVNFQTLDKWRVREKGPPYVKAHGRVLYRKEEVDRWLDAQRE